MTFHVPSVDISAYVTDGSPEERLAVAAAIDHACRTVGFIQIHGHGIPPEIIERKSLVGMMFSSAALPRNRGNAAAATNTKPPVPSRKAMTGLGIRRRHPA